MPKKKKSKKRARGRAHQAKKKQQRKRVHRTRPRTSRKVPPARRSRKSKEFLRRSKASKKGWRRRKAKERIKKEAKKKPIGKGRLLEWIVNFGLKSGGKLRERSLTAIARSEEQAIHSVYQGIQDGEDSMGADLAWMAPLDWTEVSATLAPEEGALDADEIREQGAGWIEIH